MGIETLVKVENISKSFVGVRALDSVNLKIYPGEVVGLAGENGSGKSTLIKILSGFYTPDSGSININGKNYKELTPRESMKAGIQVVYQDFSVFPNLTVAENIALNTLLVNKKKFVNKKNIFEIAESALEKINVNIPLNKRINELSVADKQLVAIARAILSDSKFIIFDEPTSAITYNEVQALFSVIRKLQEENISVLFVSHKLDEIFSICDRVFILRNGQNVINGDIKEFSRENIVHYMTGKKLTSKRVKFATSDAEDVIRVENLSLTSSYSNVSFNVKKGEVLGITGLLGSGRNDLALSLYGIKPSTHGNIYIKGEKVIIKSVQDALRNKICYIPEDRISEGLFMDQPINKNILITAIDKVSKKYGILDMGKLRQVASEWINKISIKVGSQEDEILTLSGGNQQKSVLARGLSIDPEIVILNGPTVGVDVGSKMEINALIQEIASQGAGVILISDDSGEILANCERFLIISKGQIIGEFLTKDFDEESLYKTLTRDFVQEDLNEK